MNRPEVDKNLDLKNEIKAMMERKNSSIVDACKRLNMDKDIYEKCLLNLKS